MLKKIWVCSTAFFLMPLFIIVTFHVFRRHFTGVEVLAFGEFPLMLASLGCLGLLSLWGGFPCTFTGLSGLFAAQLFFGLHALPVVVFAIVCSVFSLWKAAVSAQEVPGTKESRAIFLLTAAPLGMGMVFGSFLFFYRLKN